ncbi:UNKNOWN [Stylonychia lemnae]|uniref:Transmembrane protein n=1 Tax=Stylonychia lemnae TaxID=5949 RepID=A0A078AQ24_STYLE|nr:UNKNOWN [Stylonychia lemnae]|eukprot:CDW84269.1 UNKNOWN [Stylonychia lemnae]
MLASILKNYGFQYSTAAHFISFTKSLGTSAQRSISGQGMAQSRLFMQSMRRKFSTKPKNPSSGMSKPQKQKNENIYSAHEVPVFQFENGYYLLYYHKTTWLRLFGLYLRFLIPLAIFAYYLKKNPLYSSYPVVMPFTVIFFGITFYRMIKYSRRTNHMVQQILLDPTGTELVFIYQNKILRRLRQDNLDVTLGVAQLANPPQGDEYRNLVGTLFPEEYPFNVNEQQDLNYFFLKYYMSQRNLLAIPKKPIYANFEILCNAFATKIIDLSQATIYKIKASQIDSKSSLEQFLKQNNQFDAEKILLRMNALEMMDSLEQQILFQKEENAKQQEILDQRLHKKHTQVRKSGPTYIEGSLKEVDVDEKLQNMDKKQQIKKQQQQEPKVQVKAGVGVTRVLDPYTDAENKKTQPLTSQSEQTSNKNVN